MQDLSAFEDESFDSIIHPWSNGYINDVRPVWKECARVLKRNGLLLAGFVISGFYEDIGESILDNFGMRVSTVYYSVLR